MKCAASVWIVLVAVSAIALADRVTLKDGRVFEGNVTESEGKITINVTYGTLSFPVGEVAEIERKPTPADELQTRLAKLDKSDPAAVFAVAEWARSNGLEAQGDELLKQVIALDSDHARARRLLGQLRVDNKWITLSAAFQLAEGKLEAGAVETLLAEVVPAMEELATDAKDKLRVKHVEAYARLRAKQFENAQKCFETLAEKTTAPDSIRYAAIADILRSHPDGMYVVTDAYPAMASLTGGVAPEVEPGPASLWRPPVLAAAIKARVKAAVDEGQALMEEGKKLESTDPEAAKAKFTLALKSFDTADAMAAGNTTRPWRVDIARRRIAIITREMNTEAAKFDVMKEELGKRDLTPLAYNNLVLRMLRALNHVRTDLESILQLTAPFERDLVLETTDCNLRLQRVKALIDVLSRETHEPR